MTLIGLFCIALLLPIPVEARMRRSQSAKVEFKISNPCPATGMIGMEAQPDYMHAEAADCCSIAKEVVLWLGIGAGLAMMHGAILMRRRAGGN